MHNVVTLSDHHARTSAGSRAANRASSSAVTPFETAFSVLRTEAHHSAGTLSRCHHFETAEERAPKSDAIASRESHNSITDRNVVGSVITELIGQSVLKRKANLSLDGGKCLGHTVHMVENDSEAQYKQEFMQRVAEARISRGYKQWQIAELLGMAQDKYKQYEKRSLLPHHLIGRFCLICRVDPEWLVTGHGKKPIQPLKVAASEDEAVAPPKPKPRKSKAKNAA